MQRRVDPDQKTAGQRLVGILATRTAKLKIVGDRLDESRFQLVDGAALEGDDVPEVHDLAVEKPGIVVVGNDRLVTGITVT
jgi:hypothetical protein